MKNVKFNSLEYWEKRYASGGNSGIGSQGDVAKYKASIINSFVKDNNVKSICELGCGDWLFELFDFDNYTGYDVSKYIIDINKPKSNHTFTANMDDLTSYDLTISMDVILHLIEDDIYKKYMQDLFSLSDKYVIIYSPNEDKILGGIHNKYRKFTKDVPSDFELIDIILNPHKGSITQADFFIYEKIQK